MDLFASGDKEKARVLAMQAWLRVEDEMDYRPSLKDMIECRAAFPCLMRTIVLNGGAGSGKTLR
jgi:hypothetical protein